MIYFIQSGDHPFIKVGYAANSLERLADLQCGSPFSLRLIGEVQGSLNEEKLAHRALWKSLVRGEWFHEQPALGLLALLKSSHDGAGAVLRAAHEAERLEPVSKERLSHITAHIIAHAVDQFGMSVVAEAMDCNPKAVRTARHALSVPMLKNLANLLALDPTALDPILNEFGYTSAPALEIDHATIVAARDALNSLLRKIVVAA